MTKRWALALLLPSCASPQAIPDATPIPTTKIPPSTARPDASVPDGPAKAVDSGIDPAAYCNDYDPLHGFKFAADICPGLHGAYFRPDAPSCVASRGTVWALSIEPTKSACSELDEYEGRYTIDYVDAKGRLVRTPPRDFQWRTQHHALAWLRFATFVYDFDGDGHTELVVERSSVVAGADARLDADVFTVKDGRIVPYVPAAKLDPTGAIDLDNDGRPDLLYTWPDDTVLYADGTRRATRGDHIFMVGAHSVAGGGFVVDDDAAKSYMRRTCPRAESIPTKVENEDLFIGAVRCARLWGMSPAAARRAVDIACARPSTPGRTPVRGTCLNRDLLVKLAELPAPYSYK